MLKFCAQIFGEDYDILKSETPQSKKKVLLMGSILFIPVLLWLFQGALLTSKILGHEIHIGIIVGMICAIIIFLIERSIIMLPGKSIGVLLFRFSIGFVIAIIGATVLDEIIFHNDIDNHMADYKQELLSERLAKVDPTYKAQIHSQSEIVDQLRDEWMKASDDVKKEADGTGGSGIRGVSQITLTKIELTSQQKAMFEEANNKLDLLKSSFEIDKSEIQSELNEAFDEGSFLTRIKVLIDLIATDIYMLTLYLFFSALMCFIEFMVVIVKMSFPQTSYEFRLEAMETMQKNRSRKILNRELSNFNPGFSSKEAIDADRLMKAS